MIPVKSDLALFVRDVSRVSIPGRTVQSGRPFGGSYNIAKTTRKASSDTVAVTALSDDTGTWGTIATLSVIGPGGQITCRFEGNVSSATTTGSTLFIGFRYSDDGGSTYTYLQDIDSAPTTGAMELALPRDQMPTAWEEIFSIRSNVVYTIDVVAYHLVGSAPDAATNVTEYQLSVAGNIAEV